MINSYSKIIQILLLKPKVTFTIESLKGIFMGYFRTPFFPQCLYIWFTLFAHTNAHLSWK